MVAFIPYKLIYRMNKNVQKNSFIEKNRQMEGGDITVRVRKVTEGVI